MGGSISAAGIPSGVGGRGWCVSGQMPWSLRRFLILVFQWFLMSLSVRPGSSKAILAHLHKSTVIEKKKKQHYEGVRMASTVHRWPLRAQKKEGSPC